MGFSELLSVAAIIGYLSATGAIATRLFHHQGPNLRLALLLAGMALGCHLVVLYQDILAYDGQNMSISNVASLIAWLICLSMTLAAFSLPNTILLPVAYAFSGLLVLFNLLLPDSYIMHIEVRPALLVHITLALLAYGCLSITMLYALQVGYINYRLKHKQFDIMHSSLPPLLMVEQILFKLLLVGTVLLSLSLLSGFIFLEDMFAKQQAHKTVLSLLAWLVFAVLLAGHKIKGWRGNPVTFGVLCGTALLTLAYFGSRFVREVILH